MNKITEKQINWISWQIFRTGNNKWLESLIKKIPTRKAILMDENCDYTILDFENFLDTHFTTAQGSYFIQKIQEQDVKELINILKVNGYKFKK